MKMWSGRDEVDKVVETLSITYEKLGYIPEEIRNAVWIQYKHGLKSLQLYFMQKLAEKNPDLITEVFKAHRPTSLWVNDEIMNKVKEIAEKKGIRISDILRNCLIEFIRREREIEE